MSIFDETFENEEAALNALKEALEERDGKIVVGGDLRKTFENAVGNATDSQKQRRRAQDAEASLRELKTSLAAKEAELDEILKLNPQETQKQLQEIAREKAALVAKLKLESDQLAPLQERLANYEKNERNAKIASALRDAAKTLGVRPEALRDVERLASAFSVDPNDETIRDSQGRDGRIKEGRAIRFWRSGRLALQGADTENWDVFVSTNLNATSQEILLEYCRRFGIEEMFNDLKEVCGLGRPKSPLIGKLQDLRDDNGAVFYRRRALGLGTKRVGIDGFAFSLRRPVSPPAASNQTRFFGEKNRIGDFFKEYRRGKKRRFSRENSSAGEIVRVRRLNNWGKRSGVLEPVLKPFYAAS